MEDEVELTGGNLSKVTRLGDTVRRPSGPWTTMVHRLLEHLRARGFALGPEPLGIDASGREVLSFIPGDTMQEHPWPEWVWSDALLVEAVDALAALHAAVADFRPTFVESRLGTWPLGDDEIVCHNDLAPYNCVFDNGHLVGIIDWDVVCPGRPTWDLAFLAWHWVPLHPPGEELAWRTDEECRRRLRLLADAYGLTDRPGFVELILARVEASRIGITERAAGGEAPFIRLVQEGHADAMARTRDFIRSIEVDLTQALVG
jgi:hypothetical protein